MTDAPRRTAKAGHHLTALLALTVAYTAAAWAGLNWATVAGAGSPVWPASGVALAGLLLGGLRLWPAILIGRLLAAWLSGSGQPLWADAAIAAANVAGTVLPILLLRRLGGIDPRLPALPDLLRYLAVAAGGAIISALFGTLALALSSGLSLPRAEAVFVNWIVGNFVGAITLGPLILAWARPERLSRGDALHLLAILLATVALAWIVFSTPESEALRTWHLLPALVWAALAFNVRGAAAALMITSIIAVWATAAGLGPFAQIASDPAARVPLLQQFIAITGITTLMLAAIADERRGKEALRAAKDRLEAVLESAALGGWHWNYRTGDLQVNRRWAEMLGLTPGQLGNRIGDWESRIHPDDLPRIRAVLDEHLAGRTPAYSTEVRLRHADGRWLWVLASGRVIERDADGRPLIVTGTHLDIDARETARAERERLAAIMDATTDFVGVGGPDGRILYLNPAARRALGIGPVDPVDGYGRDAFYPPAARKRLDEVGIPEALRTGQWQGENVLRALDGHEIPVSQVLLIRRKPDGALDYYATIARDITETKRAEERERLLAREVDHRAKNLLAVVQSVVQLTRAATPEAFKPAVAGRIRALGRAHSLLSDSRWEGADLRRIVTEELAPFMQGGDRIRLDGPSLQLKPAAAQSLALVIHELATNAIKHGALSTPEGRLEVAWLATAQDDATLRFRWQERGGPPAAAPTARGFGSTVIQSSVERQLKGRVVLDWHPEGLVCEIDLPSAQITLGSQPDPAAPAAPPAPPAAPATSARILLLEDEALIALQAEKALRDAGFAVDGPHARVAEALDRVRTGELDAALLDVNVAGEQSFAVADRLAAAGLPFAFCTGYAEDAAVPERFARVPILPKPFADEELAGLARRMVAGAGSAAAGGMGG